MDKESLLIAAVLVPLVSAFILPLAGRISSGARNLLSLAVVSASFLFSLSLIPSAMNGAVITVAKELVLGVNLVFVADPLAVFMACVSSGITAVIVLYSVG
jgi:NADH:ubiquinone oxidoreductase subunit 5 (subunit L)/multisubunit Na+/H+ antiporter MnhA subunit